jgi:hypothetical protein
MCQVMLDNRESMAELHSLYAPRHILTNPQTVMARQVRATQVMAVRAFR